MNGYVLTAVDLSHPETDMAVLRKAKQLADLEGAPLAVVTVLPDYGSSFVGSFFPDEQSHDILEKARHALHEFVREGLGDDRDIQHVIRMGTTYQEVLKTAEKLDVRLIVIGSSKPDVTDFLIGPNAARISRHANCSVHICR